MSSAAPPPTRTIKENDVLVIQLFIICETTLEVASFVTHICAARARCNRGPDGGAS
ncbi:MAG: hypothetical protein ACLP6E_06995 [Acidimicrobiales bacterium]